jgi:intracellular septation protein
MQLLFDFFPVIAFFITYKLTGDLFAATAVIIVAVIAQTAIQWFRHRKVSSMSLISGVLVLIFGGLTLLIHDKAFIQWKVTVVNWLFALGFLASRFIGDKVMIQRMMGEHVQLEPALWRRLNWAWTSFFAALGAINLYVAYNFSEATWVNFKLYGMIGLTAAFAIGQGLWLANKMPAETPSEPQGSSK